MELAIASDRDCSTCSPLQKGLRGCNEDPPRPFSYKDTYGNTYKRCPIKLISPLSQFILSQMLLVQKGCGFNNILELPYWYTELLSTGFAELERQERLRLEDLDKEHNKNANIQSRFRGQSPGY